MANKGITKIITFIVGALLATQTAAFAESISSSNELSKIAEKQGETAAKLGTKADATALLNLSMPANLPDSAFKRGSIRAVVGGINFTSADVDNTCIPFVTRNAATLNYLFHDGGEWTGYPGNPTTDDGKGSGESQAEEIYDVDGNKHYPKACLRYIGAHCYIFVPVMFFPTLPRTLSASEAETPKAYASWNMSWSHNPNLKYSPDATSGTVIEPRFILGNDKAMAKLKLARIADEFDSQIYPKIREYLGTEPDVDGDPKVFIFLDDIRDLNNSHLGYFDPANQLLRSMQPLSNEKEIIFLDIFKYYENSNEVMGTLAHEFSHMVIFNSSTEVKDGKMISLETWLHEGITQYVEYLYTKKFPANLDEFIKNPDTILVDKRDSTWQGSSPYANYGASFLWIYYLAEKYGYSNVPNFLKSIINANVDKGVANVDTFLRSFNTDMKEAFKDWVVANYLDKVYKSDSVTLLNDGKWGYKADADKDTSNDVGYNRRLPIPPTENLVLANQMNTRSGTVNSWAGDCISLSGNTGNLNIAFDGSDNASFRCAIIKKGRAVDTTCEFMNLDPVKNCGNLIIQNYGTTGTYENVLLIPLVNSNFNYEKLSYVYSGSFDDLKVGIFPNPVFENNLNIVVRTEKEFAAEPRIQLTFGGKQGYLTVAPVNNSTYITNYTISTDGEGTIVCTGTNKDGVILSNSLNFTASYYKAGSSGALLNSRFATLDIPSGAISENGTVVMTSNQNVVSYEGLSRMSSNVDLAMPGEETNKDLEMTIPIDTSVRVDGSKAGLYRATAAGQKWVGPAVIAEGKAKGGVRAAGSYFIAADEVAPTVESMVENRGNGRYAIRLSDAGSGINPDSVKVSCNGMPLNTVWNDGEVVVDTSSMKAAMTSLDVVASDRVGNSVRAAIKVFAGSKSLEQITSYPNPARNGRAVIRATVKGDDGSGVGSIKIYDVRGHKVMEGQLVNKSTGVYEYQWNLTNKKNKRVANGTYLADVKISFGGESHKERIKIAVLN